MSAAARRLAALALMAALATGGQCGGGSGSGGSGAEIRVAARPVENADARCAALRDAFPPGFAFVPGLPGRAVAASLGMTPSLVPFDLEVVPPEIPDSTPILEIPLDSDGDGVPEGFGGPAPFLDDVFAIDATLGLATASGYEEVLFFHPAAGELAVVDIEVPASVPVGERPELPAPGTRETRTGLSTRACIRAPAGALDSRGEPILDSLCDPGAPSFRASFTSGAALVAERLFVSTSNLGAGRGGPAPQYRSGSVLVFDFDRSASPPLVRPHASTPFVLTSGFNPTHVTPYHVDGRAFVLVTVSGALGIEADDPATTSVEAAGIALSEGALDVIDAATLELVATIPLGLGTPAFDGPAIHPAGRIALIGSAVQRALYAVDLAPLATLPERVAAPLLLHEAVIFDADAPFRTPARVGGASAASCPGATLGVAFDHTGERAYVGEFCDGTLSRIAVDTSGAPSTAQLRERFLLLDLAPLVAPLRQDTLGQQRGLGRIAVRPGVPGVDFQGPEVFFLVAEDGQLCGISLASR